MKCPWLYVKKKKPFRKQLRSSLKRFFSFILLPGFLSWYWALSTSGTHLIICAYWSRDSPRPYHTNCTHSRRGVFWAISSARGPVLLLAGLLSVILYRLDYGYFFFVYRIRSIVLCACTYQWALAFELNGRFFFAFICNGSSVSLFFFPALHHSYHYSGKSNSASKLCHLAGAFVIVLSVIFFLLLSACKESIYEGILPCLLKEKHLY